MHVRAQPFPREFAVSAQAAGGPHHRAFMKTTAYVWMLMVTFTVSDFARGVDKNVIKRPFHVLLRFM